MKNVKGVTSIMGSATHGAKRCAELIAVLIDDQADAEAITKIESILRRYGEDRPNMSVEELGRMRVVAEELHVVFSTVELGGMVWRINLLLDEYTQTPRLTNHRQTPWHLHVDGDNHAPWPEWFAASSAFALSILIAEKQRRPGGICLVAECKNPYIDLGKGGGRSFCSPRCATRYRVAQYRKRQRD